MTTHRGFTWLLAAGVLGLALSASASDDKKEKPKAAEDRKGTLTGKVTEKGGYWIEVQADGEEKARKYYCGSNQAALKAVKATEVGSRIRLEWRFEEVFRVVTIEVLKKPAEQAPEPRKVEPKKTEKK